MLKEECGWALLSGRGRRAIGDTVEGWAHMVTDRHWMTFDTACPNVFLQTLK